MQRLGHIISIGAKSLCVILCLMFLVTGIAYPQSESEPNDQREQANTLPLNQAVTGHAFPEDDEDWYLFSVPEPGMDILVIELSAISGVDLSLSLFDDDGNELKETDYDDDDGGEIIVRMKVKPGKYYINVLAYIGSDEEATYTLSVKPSTRPPATEEEVRQALANALDYLALEQAPEGHWMGIYEESPGISGLALMAFLGGGCVPKNYS